MQNRENSLQNWVKEIYPTQEFKWLPLAGDASFRRYFRLSSHNNSYILMDAPPEKESIESFLAVGNLLQTLKVTTPQIYAFDKALGCILLEDFGDKILLSQLAPNNAKLFYQTAIIELLKMQECASAELNRLPVFDKHFIKKELALFKDWFLKAYLKLNLTTEEADLLETSFAWLAEEIQSQPQVFIHRDYHSRNIMVLPSSTALKLGIIDFQDAMRGPLAYDLVSLLKDCYIQWPRAQILDGVRFYYEQLKIPSLSYDAFIRAFDLCGLQRHLKVLGVFSRLALRDKKNNYLNDLPLTLHYVKSCLESYAELKPLYQFIQTKIQLP